MLRLITSTPIIISPTVSLLDDYDQFFLRVKDFVLLYNTSVMMGFNGKFLLVHTNSNWHDLKDVMHFNNVAESY